jgi:hypothetical protein
MLYFAGSFLNVFNMENIEKQPATEESVWAAFRESDRERKEYERLFKEQIAESDRQRKENERILNEKFVETDRKFAETDRKFAETERLLKEQIAKQEKEWNRTMTMFNDLKKEIGGIANSNGEIAEEYFENIFIWDKTFAGMHFHEIIKRKKFDDRKRMDEFDIIMLNEKNVVIVETKYKAKESNIDDIIEKAASFRYWYPEYKDHNVYLCLASLRFEDNIIGKARKKGIAILQQLGDKTVVNDENLRAY